MGCRAVPWREARTARPWARLPEWQLRPCNRTRTARAPCRGRCTRLRARATSRPLARADAALDVEPAARDRAAGQSGLRALCCPRSCGAEGEQLVGGFMPSPPIAASRSARSSRACARAGGIAEIGEKFAKTARSRAGLRENENEME